MGNLINVELLRFLFVGVGSNVINYIAYLFIHSIGISLFFSSIGGYSIGLLISYHFGRVWVFGRKFYINKKTFIRFIAVYAIGGLGMSILIEILDQTTGIDYRMIWCIGAVFAVVNNFLGLKWLVFNGKEEKNNGK